MKIFFWICWICNVVFLFIILSALVKTYTSGVMASKSTKEIFDFVMLLSGMAAVVIAAIILYSNQWLKTAALVASTPLLTLLFIFLIPIIAYISGERMN